MPRRRSVERGEGNLGCIVWLILLTIGVMIAWKAVPVKIARANALQDLTITPTVRS